MPLDQSCLRSKYGVTVVGVKRQVEGFTYAAADSVINRGDVLILAGRTSEVERVADLARGFRALSTPQCVVRFRRHREVPVLASVVCGPAATWQVMQTSRGRGSSR